MATTLLLATVGGVLFILGVFIGTSVTERAVSARTRRQAAFQQQLNAQWKVIKAAAAHNRLRGQTSGLGWNDQGDMPLIVDGEVILVSDEALAR